MKKPVPDWLNSSLWSSPHPLPSSPRNDSVIDVPISPTAAVRTSEPPTAGESKDPLTSNASGHCSNEETGGSSENPTASVAAPPAAEDISRQTQIQQELSRKVINMGELRKLASQGIPDGAGIRATVWKLLLGYLPADRSLWPSELAKKRSQYKHFKEELLMNPSEITRQLEQSGLENHEFDGSSQGFLSRSEISHGEHPLSLGKSSVWNQFFQETEIVEQIDRDVMRTHPDINFFSGDSIMAKSNREALRSILIVYAKLNPGIRYVQGMIEILAPLFYIFRNDPNEENAASGVKNNRGRSYGCGSEAVFFESSSSRYTRFKTTHSTDPAVQDLQSRLTDVESQLAELRGLFEKMDGAFFRHGGSSSGVPRPCDDENEINPIGDDIEDDDD